MTEEKESPFRFLNSILNGRSSIVETEQDAQEYKKIAFLTNRGISQHPDCIMWVNEINQYPGLDPKMQYDYLFRNITKVKRGYGKWAKGVKQEDVKKVQEKYSYSERKAKEVLRLFPDLLGDKK